MHTDGYGCIYKHTGDWGMDIVKASLCLWHLEFQQQNLECDKYMIKGAFS